MSTSKLLSSGIPPLLAAPLCLLLLLPASRANGAGLLIADRGAGALLEIKEQTVAVTINNGIAVTQLTQIFKNNEKRQVEALYTFPVPKDASVANFSMWIGGKEMVGEVIEKVRACDIYNSYKRLRRDPGVLEQSDFRSFEMRIFPIAPLAEEKVQITYYQELEVDRDWATYVYPLATATRPGLNNHTTGTFSLTIDVKSQIPIVGMESPSHPQAFAVARHSENYFQASFETRAGDLSRDVVLAYHLSRPNTGIDMMTSRQGAEDGYFCLTLTAGEEQAGREAGMDYVFILDISGSMNDDGKLALSRNSLAAFINALGAKDRFEVMAFNVEPQPLFRRLVEAGPGRKEAAAAFLASQQARGGTVLHPALTTAYKYADPARPLNVVILSDGLTEENERPQLMQLIAQRPGNSRVFCIGVGNDVDRALLNRMADDAGGLAAFVSREDNFDRQAAAFRRKLMHPVATDIKLDFAGASVYDLEPRKLPSLYSGMPIRVYGRYRDPGAAQLTLSATIDGKPDSRMVPLIFPGADSSNPEIERMWALQKVKRLLSDGDAAGSRTSAIDEIVRLGQAYSIVTEYTSFLVLENDLEYQRWQIERKNVMRLKRDRAAEQVLSTELQSLRNKSTDNLGPEPAEPPASSTPAATPSKPDPSTPPGPQSSSPAQRANSRGLRPHNSGDIDMGGRPGAGGGAIDPISGTMVLILAGLYFVGRRKRDAGDRSNA